MLIPTHEYIYINKYLLFERNSQDIQTVNWNNYGIIRINGITLIVRNIAKEYYIKGREA